MAGELRDRLTDLATHTPSGTPPADLWTRGVRRRRASQATTSVLVAALVLILGVGGWTWHTSRHEIQPAAPHGAPHLPDRFYYQPSAWLGSFDGPPGALVTVLPAEQKTMLHTRQGLVGVTAVDGRYGFLRLPPNAVLDGNVTSPLALAPDGRRLAFWLSGSPTGSPNTILNAGRTITGIGTYDTVTGRVRTYSVPTAHGISPSLLLWADNDTLTFAFEQITGGDDSGEDSGSARYAGRGVWRAADTQPTMVPGGENPAFLDNSSTRAAGGSLLAPASRSGRWTLLPAAAASPQGKFQSRPTTRLLVPDSQHTQVAAVLGGSSSDTGPLAVGALPTSDSAPGAEVRLHAVQGAGQDWFRPLAWVDADHVAALRRVVVHEADGNEHVAGEVDLVDVRDGTATKLVSEFGSNGSNESDAWLATGLLGAPSVHATPPPDPWDRRAVAIGLLIGFGLLGGILLIERRSRVRRP